MKADLNQAIHVITRCRQLRQQGVTEAVLRGEFQSYLRLIFPDAGDTGWLNHYTEGSEAHTRVGYSEGLTVSRFIDNLIGSTTIEYEADLRIATKRNTGLHQVREHVAGLIRQGFPVSQIRGILSDTVDWYAYDVELSSNTEPHVCTINDIELLEIDSLESSVSDERTAERLVTFMRKHFAREQSRKLIADNLVLDIGLESPSYRRYSKTLIETIESNRSEYPSVKLATDLWSQFVDHLEIREHAFRLEAYVDELYLSIVARILCANVLAGTAINSNDEELQSILDGSFFRNKYHLRNFVEQDYFGWIGLPEHIATFLPIANEIQRDIRAYDFVSMIEGDLFGRLMAQLSRKSHRKLLGQEWTPAWLARHLAEHCLNELPEDEIPAIIDICCGSGTILVEFIRVVKDDRDYNDINIFQSIITGFDIDPLAVIFAKTNWVISLREEINNAAVPVTIPVYHSDSLFISTPTSDYLPIFGEANEIDVNLDGEIVQLPIGLIQPEFHNLFDQILDWIYDESQQSTNASLALSDAERFLDGIAINSNVNLSSDLRQSTIHAIYHLAQTMKKLASLGRNGIWAFILRNTYRPGFFTNHFNGLISNPPWLTMSTLADNPYKNILSHYAESYGITPPGSSFLHLELSTIHLLHAVDRYLRPNAVITCLIPGTVFNGHHHEPLRQRKYLNSARAVALSLNEVWQIASGTFKYPSAAIIGQKKNFPAEADHAIKRGCTVDREEVNVIDLAVCEISDIRTAWVLERDGFPVTFTSDNLLPTQGADIMPRRAVCIEVVESNGPEFRVNTPDTDSKLYFTVKKAKKLRGVNFPGYAAQNFIHIMAQSENLLPFALGTKFTPIAIPATRNKDIWEIHNPTTIRRMGFTNTARRFEAINTKLIEEGDSLEDRINVRNKLTNQKFGNEGHLIVYGAGGKYICAACLYIPDSYDIVIDQTLYWQIITNENEAWYMTGILNSEAMTDAILPFNPKGDFGPRHIHTLPYRVMPPFDSTNEEHMNIAKLAREITQLAHNVIANNRYIDDPNRELSKRRERMREELNKYPEKIQLEKACAAILGTGISTE